MEVLTSMKRNGKKSCCCGTGSEKKRGKAVREGLAAFICLKANKFSLQCISMPLNPILGE